MRLSTDLSPRPAHLPIVPLLQALTETGNRYDDWWDTRDPEGATRVAEVHTLDSVGDEPPDAIVVPLDWYWVRGPSWASRPNRALRDALAEAVDRLRSDPSIPTIAFFTGDRSNDRTGLEDTVVFREGIRRSQAGDLDRPMPAFCDDLVVEHLGGELSIRPHGGRPVVGFCGLARARDSIRDRAREAAAMAVIAARERRLDRSPFTGERLRIDALEALRGHRSVDTNFIVRESSVFFGATHTEQVRREYVDNLVDCDYVLCVRGSGNYSFRLYEAMGAGRVPVIVDTDLDLPAANDVPWRDIAVWIDEDDVESIGDAVAEFHERLSPTEFVDLQTELRRLWLDHLRASAWLSNLDRHITR